MSRIWWLTATSWITKITLRWVQKLPDYISEVSVLTFGASEDFAFDCIEFDFTTPKAFHAPFVINSSPTRNLALNTECCNSFSKKCSNVFDVFLS
jgi:hypothetical protein